MKPEIRERLVGRGWRVGSAEEFLELSAEESILVELRLRLADAVKVRRKERHLTQAQLARLLGSSQSRVAKVEAAADSVSLDLLIRTLLALGATPQELAAVIGSGSD
jgi:predicted XRE-type DNA-binding protein